MPALRHVLWIALIALGTVWPLTRAEAADATANTATAGTAAAQAQNRYRVEMVFFTFNSPANFTQEQWRQGLPQPDLAHALDLFGGHTAPGFKVLPPSAYELDSAAKRLQASGRYTVIGHVAWEQPGLDIKQAVPVVITGGADYGPLYPQLMQPRFIMRAGQAVEVPAPQHLYQLYGTVKIVLSRYLHLYTDLVLRVPTKPQEIPAPATSTQTDQTSPVAGSQPDQNPTLASNATSAPGPATGNPAMQTKLVEDVPVIANPQNAQPAPGGTLTEVHIIEHRRTRSKQLNYVDHPMLGILFEIWPIGNSR
ncbi:MAG: CsiV family protein [Acidihalobacter sp.]